MAKAPQRDELAETKRIMERLVKMPRKLHKDEPPHKPGRSTKERVRKGTAH